MVVTLHFQSTGTVPSNARPVEMVGASITVGRGAENDLVLPDPTKVLSKRHCAIEKDGARVRVVDFSTNGTFLNYGRAPIGPSGSALNDGDILTVGPYELLVQIPRSKEYPAATASPSAATMPQESGLSSVLDDILDGPGGGGDVLDELLGDTAPTGPKSIDRPDPGDDGLLPPLDADDLLGPRAEPFGEMGGSQFDHNPSASDAVRVSSPQTGTIPEDWGDDDLLGVPSDTIPPAQTIPDDPFAEPGDVTAPQDVTTPSQPAAPAPASGAVGDAPARAFLKAAGAEGINVPDAELEATMSRLGQVFSTMVRGLREILMARATVKSEFRIDQTMISAGGNNPLKFSVSPEQAVEAMVRPSTTGYLEAPVAADEALKDIRAHEIAMAAGMEEALKGVLRQLSPQALESRIETGGGLSGILKGKKARYWEVYEKLYAEISDQAETDFHDLFAKEFARAYKAQLERLK